MWMLWFSLLIVMLILSLLKPFVADFELVSLVVVFSHSLLVLIVVAGMKNRFRAILLGGFLGRLAFLFWDLYAKSIYVLPNSGSDSEVYYRNALAVANDLAFMGSSLTVGFYSKLMGSLFYFIGPQRLIGQYLNVLLGLSVLVVLYKILEQLEIKPAVTRLILLLAAFFPNSLIMSSIFLREIIPTFFVTASFYFFIRWFKTGGGSQIFASIAMLGVASLFHSGVVGLLFGYAFVFLFYRQEQKAYRFTARTVVVFLGMTVAGYVAYAQFGDYFFSKFSHVDEFNDVYAVANRREGGAAYLVGLEINSPAQLVLYGAVKGFYFLTSPLPMNWRGFMDVFTFVFDSMLYVTAVAAVFKNRQFFRGRWALVAGIVLIIIGGALVFGLGVSNAGAAVRHRQKMLPIFFVLLAMALDSKKDKPREALRP